MSDQFDVDAAVASIRAALDPPYVDGGDEAHSALTMLAAELERVREQLREAELEASLLHDELQYGHD